MSHQQKHSRKRRCSVAQVFALGDFLFLFVRVIRIRVVDISSRTSLCWVGYWHTCLETLFSDMRLAWWCFDAVGPESRCCNVSELADTLEGDLKFLDHLINFIPIVRNRDFEIKTIPAMRIREFFFRRNEQWTSNWHQQLFFWGTAISHRKMLIAACDVTYFQHQTAQLLRSWMMWFVSAWATSLGHGDTS